MTLALATGFSKTLLNSQTPRLDFGIDYLTLIYPAPTGAIVASRLDDLAGVFADSWPPAETGRFIGKSYSNYSRTPRGMVATWNLPGESGDSEGSLRVSIPGSVCASIPFINLVSVVKTAINDYHATVSRIDFKIDDYSRLVSFEQITEAYHSGNYARFRIFDPREKFKSGRSLGRTIYLGTRDSARFVRVYDALPVHQIDATRWELELKRELADSISQVLVSMDLNDVEAIRTFVGAVVVGCVEFVDRSSGDKNLSRCPRLDWWAAFVDAVGGSLRFSLPKFEPVLRRTLSFLERLSATFATVSAAVGKRAFFEYMRVLISDGETRMGSRHFAILHSSRSEWRLMDDCVYEC